MSLRLGVAIGAFVVVAMGPLLEGQVPFLRGDVNDDGRVSISDAHYLSLWLFGNGPPSACVKAADADDDGIVGLGGLDANRNDVQRIAIAATCDESLCPNQAIATPRDRPEEDPTPDDLPCEAYTAAAGWVVDPAARMEILDATCPGGDSSLAVVKVRISHSRWIGGYSGVIEGLFTRALTSQTVAGTRSNLGRPEVAVVRDGRVHFSYLDLDRLEGSLLESPSGFLPPAQDHVVLKIYLELAQGVPAGIYPLILLEGELADSLTGRAIAPGLVDGLLTVEADVTPDARADPISLAWGPRWECHAGEAASPRGPEDVQVAFHLGLVPGDRGSRATVPVWIEANVPVEGFNFAIVYPSTELRLASVVPHPAERQAWDVFEHDASADPRGNLWGRAIFGSSELPASLPPDRRHHVLDLEFEVQGTAQDEVASVQFHRLSTTDTEAPAPVDWQNAVLAYGQLLEKGQVTCFETNRGKRSGVIIGQKTAPFLRGDANADGAISLADAVLTGHPRYHGNRLRIPCEDAADADDDGGGNYGDAIRIFRHLFEPPAADTAIPAPFPEPGADETLDPLPCEEYSVRPSANTLDELRLGDAEAAPGEAIQVPVYATTSRRLTAYQLVVRYAPESFTPTLDELRLDGSVFAGLENGFGINFVAREPHPGYLAVAFAADLIHDVDVPAGHDMLLGKLEGFVSETLQPGDELLLEAVAFPEVDAPRPDRLRTEFVEVEDGKLVTLLPTLGAGRVRIVDGSDPTFLRGDANGDLEVNISDPVFTLSYLFLGGREPPCADAADADDSGRLELTDAIFTLGFLFGVDGARPLPPPYPESGRDGEPDALAPCREAAR